MSAILHCPFCHAELPDRAAVCQRCQARRHVRSGMSLRGFRWFVACWLALAVPLMLLALWVALVPWLPRGEPPGYALALVGARPVETVPRCRVEVVDAAGRTSQALSDGPCGTASATAPAHAQPEITTLRMAAAVHSALTLAAGAFACWVLLRLLRRPFLQRSAPSWVRRAAA
jgi:hypothetical protein